MSSLKEIRASLGECSFKKGTLCGDNKIWSQCDACGQDYSIKLLLEKLDKIELIAKSQHNQYPAAMLIIIDEILKELE